MEVGGDRHRVVLRLHSEWDLLTPRTLEDLLQLSDRPLHLVAATQVYLVDHNKDGNVQRQRKPEVLLRRANWETDGD